MKNKLIIVIVILIVFIIGLSIYKFGNYNNEVNTHYFVSSEMNKYRYENNNAEVLDNVTYKDEIINDNVLSMEYRFFHDTQSIIGKIYIGTDKYLYITDTNKNSTYRVSTVKFKTIYYNEYEYSKGIYVWLLSESNKIYLMSLESNDITKAEVISLDDEEEYTNFVNLRFREDLFPSGNTIFLLDKNGNIYELYSGFRYRTDIISLYSRMYICSDGTITNSNGMLAQDKNGDSYKIKYIFDTYQNNKFIPDYKIIVITEDNRFIYFDDDMETVYEFSKKVKDLNFDVNYPYKEGNLKITFEDEYNVDLKASCNQYFCVNYSEE